MKFTARMAFVIFVAAIIVGCATGPMVEQPSDLNLTCEQLKQEMAAANRNRMDPKTDSADSLLWLARVRHLNRIFTSRQCSLF